MANVKKTKILAQRKQCIEREENTASQDKETPQYINDKVSGQSDSVAQGKWRCNKQCRGEEYSWYLLQQGDKSNG